MTAFNCHINHIVASWLLPKMAWYLQSFQHFSIQQKCASHYMAPTNPIRNFMTLFASFSKHTIWGYFATSIDDHLTSASSLGEADWCDRIFSCGS